MNAIMDIYFSLHPTNGWVCGMDTNSFYSPPYYGRFARTRDGGNTLRTTVLTTPTSPVRISRKFSLAVPDTSATFRCNRTLPSTTSFSIRPPMAATSWVSSGISLAGLEAGQFRVLFAGHRLRQHQRGLDRRRQRQPRLFQHLPAHRGWRRDLDARRFQRHLFYQPHPLPQPDSRFCLRGESLHLQPSARHPARNRRSQVAERGDQCESLQCRRGQVQPIG